MGSKKTQYFSDESWGPFLELFTLDDNKIGIKCGVREYQKRLKDADDVSCELMTLLEAVAYSCKMYLYTPGGNFNFHDVVTVKMECLILAGLRYAIVNKATMPAEGCTDWVVFMYKTYKCFINTVIADRELIRKDKDMAEYFRKIRNIKFTSEWKLVPRSLLLQGQGRILGENGDLEGDEEGEDAWGADDAMM